MRRIAGFVQIDHRVGLADEPNAWLTQELASHRLGSSFPTIWAEAAVDARLVLDQAAAIRDAFRTVGDVAHFCSDRPHLAPPWAQGDAAHSGTPASLSEAETSQTLARLGREILGPGFALAPPTETFGLRIARAEVGGFRHGAYVEANVSSTLAVIVIFALPSHVFSAASSTRMRGAPSGGHTGRVLRRRPPGAAAAETRRTDRYRHPQRRAGRALGKPPSEPVA